MGHITDKPLSPPAVSLTDNAKASSTLSGCGTCYHERLSWAWVLQDFSLSASLQAAMGTFEVLMLIIKLDLFNLQTPPETEMLSPQSVYPWNAEIPPDVNTKFQKVSKRLFISLHKPDWGSALLHTFNLGRLSSCIKEACALQGKSFLFFPIRVCLIEEKLPLRQN